MVVQSGCAFMLFVVFFPSRARYLHSGHHHCHLISFSTISHLRFLIKVGIVSFCVLFYMYIHLLAYPLDSVKLPHALAGHLKHPTREQVPLVFFYVPIIE